MERTSVMSAERSPVVVAGMHRSGTSLVASVLSALGVDMGGRLLPADAHNPRGYFENEKFLSLNRRMLDAATLAGDGGHRDWGWTESERLDRGCLPQFIEAAGALVAEHAGAVGRWGWKDPRTTLLLDFWHGLLPDPAYALVYRFPWDVAVSMQRLGTEVFLRHQTACALVRKEAWRSCGGYDAAMPAPGWEDWDLWLGLAARGWGFRHLPVAATDCRVRPGSLLWAFEEEEARLPVLRYLVAKHREVYRSACRGSSCRPSARRPRCSRRPGGASGGTPRRSSTSRVRQRSPRGWRTARRGAAPSQTSGTR